MENKIIKLSNETILKIAAGEVVERPASIIKELVENSIDANATAITVEIQDGGIKYIRVVDNGIGIPEDMICLAFERHSTSKIQSEEDLFNIHTLGFRGEALASIAAVSKVTLNTRHINATNGISVQNNGGKIENIMPTGYALGTSILVQDLFYNTPVRLKFLKKPALEASAITDLMARMILSHPNISFRYINNGKCIYHSLGDSEILSAIARVYDSSTAKNMVAIHYSENQISIKGYIGIFELEKSNRSFQTFFINNRYFKSDIISNALEEATKGLVTISKFPMAVLFIQTPHHFVDVNVHPNKLEVRFEDNEVIYNAVKNAVTNAVNQISIHSYIEANERENDSPKITNALIDSLSSIDIERPITHGGELKLNDSFSNAPFTPPQLQGVNALVDNSNIDSELSTVIELKNSLPIKNSISPIESNVFISNEINISVDYKIIGTVFNSFILVERKDQLWIIDQHAAQERINFERLMEAYNNKTISQKLLFPILVELTIGEIEILKEYQHYLFRTGFEFEVFDDTSITIRAVPMILGEPMQIEKCFHEIFQDLYALKHTIATDIIRDRILQSACKHSIKAGEKLNDISLKGLLRDMFEKNITPTCPHGRPILIPISKNELYKKFKRIQ